MNSIERFKYCPVCGSPHFVPTSEKSLRCEACGFEYFMNASAANVALIINEREELLVTRRNREPAKDTLDMPGGFADAYETAEEGVVREVMEETGLEVTQCQYLFSIPNCYNYSGIDIPTLDMFFRCHVRDVEALHAADDAAEAFWIPIREVDPSQIGLRSIREGVKRFITLYTTP